MRVPFESFSSIEFYNDTMEDNPEINNFDTSKKIDNTTIQTVFCIDKMPLSVSKSGSQSALLNTSLVWNKKDNDRNAITISFDGDFIWSYIGRDSIGKSPSMNLGFVDPPESNKFKNNEFSVKLFNNKKNVILKAKYPNFVKRNGCTDMSCESGYVPGASVLHSFGHALGLYHEHKNSKENPIVFKTPKEIREVMVNECISYNCDYGRCAGKACDKCKTKCINDTMSEDFIKTNLINRFEELKGFFESTVYDPKSIMLYPLKKEFIVKGNPVNMNYTFSETDKKMLNKYYPKGNGIVINVKFIKKPKATMTSSLSLSNDKADPDYWKVCWVIYLVMSTIVPMTDIEFKFYDGNTYLGSSKKSIKENYSQEEIEETSQTEFSIEKQKEIIEKMVKNLGYPRPQGNLAMNPWGLKDNGSSLNGYYQNVMDSSYGY